MALMWTEGDYAPNGQGGLRTVTGAEAVLQRMRFRLTARRGSFPFLPELGSRLYLLPREKPSAREILARQYAVEALAGEELEVTEVTVDAGEERRLAVKVLADWRGQTLEAAVTV